MATCPDGHESAATDFCDTCGMRIGGGPAVASSGSTSPGGEVCPQCGTDRGGQFCEVCGFDYTTGTPSLSPPAPLSPLTGQPDPGAAPAPLTGQPDPGAATMGTSGPPDPPLAATGAPDPFAGQPDLLASAPGIPDPLIPDPLIPDPLIPDPLIPDPLAGQSGPITSAAGQDPYATTAGQHFPGVAAGQDPAVGATPYGSPAGQDPYGSSGLGPIASGAVRAGVGTAAPSQLPAGDLGLSGGSAWTATVTADRDYFDAVIAAGGPDAASIEFPSYCPERKFTLTGNEMRIGRRSASRGLEPEIDLTGPPTDPGISHLHAVLIAQPDGWAVLDPGSSNGTQVNGDDVATGVPHPLQSGDRVCLGAWTVLTIQAP